MPPYRVLVVEDEKLIRANVAEKIEQGSQKFVVVGTAADGEQALALFAAGPVDVLFTDIRMPVMDGLALAKAVRTLYPAVQIVIVSGYADFAYAQHAIRLGVEEYLLKPLKRDALLDVLTRIDAKLTQAARRADFELVRDAINGSLGAQRAASSQEYALFLLNIGNLCGVTASSTTRGAYAEIWRGFDFAALQARYPGLMLVNSSAPNARYLVLPLAGSFDCAVTRRIFDELSGQASGINVNLFYGSPAALDALYALARALQLGLEQNLIIDESKNTDIATEAPKPPAAVLPAAVYSRLVSLIGHGQVDALEQEVKGIVASALAQRQSQLWIQDHIHQIIELFQRHSAAISQEEIYHAEYQLFDGMSLPGSGTALVERTWRLLRTMLRDVPKETPASRELIDSIRSYLAANYDSPITLDDLAQQYNFTPSYLIKAFKRQVGESPIQYLIRLRMEEAKRLLSTAPDLEIRQIGEIVGYADPHYFSRIFRNTSGVTPSEYRSQHTPPS
jgi:two-component system, response regulator YesN